MLCKYYLQIGSSIVDTSSDQCFDVSECVANGADLSQSFVRKDYGGVTRKYGSTIEFCGFAYEQLVELYRERYLTSEAAFAIHVIDDNWEYSEAWQCPLDFATFSYDEHKVSINCIDSSAAALIKANGGIKCSYDVRSIKSPYTLNYDRVVVSNLLTFGFIGHTQEGTTDMLWSIDDVTYGFYRFSCVPLSVRDTSGVVDNKCTWQNEDQIFYNPFINTPRNMASIATIEGRTYFLKAGASDAVVTLDFSGTKLTPTEVKTYSTGANDWLGPNQIPYTINYYLAVWNDEGTDFRIVAQSSFSGYNTPFVPFGGKVSVPLPAGYNLSLIFEDGYWDDDLTEGSTYYWRHLWFMQMSSAAVNVHWDSRGDSIYMDVIEPKTLLNSLLDTVSDGKMKLVGSIDLTVGGTPNYRLLGTQVIAAESVRGLADAVLHTSFKDFCSFMEAEFGYVYCIEDYTRPSVVFQGFIEPEDVNGKLWTGTSLDAVDEVYFIRTGEWSSVVANPAGLFVGFNVEKGRYYTFWGNGPSWSAYNHRNNTRNPYNYSLYEPNTDILFVDETDGNVYVHHSGVLDLQAYDEKRDKAALIRFLHRSDLFSTDVVKELKLIGSPVFSMSEDLLYAGVRIGYDKQEYNQDNTGRDEWNFTNEYRTGVALKDQKLELICPYRADCYGIEELVSVREKTDGDREQTGSDEDVFIVKCKAATVDDCWQIDRTMSISGTYTDTVFNAFYAPVMMVMANSGYIASFCSHLAFSMTSGSRDVVVNLKPVTRNFDFSESDRMFKAGVLTVKTDDQSLPEDLSGLVSFECNGVLYKGYIRSVVLKYQREETVEYELIEQSQTAT